MRLLEEREYKNEIDGDVLALDFSNTLGDRHGEQPIERLGNYAVLVSWGRQAGALTSAQAERFLKEAEARPAKAEDTLEKAKVLRETINRLLTSGAAHRPAAGADLDTLNETLSEAMSHLRLVQHGHNLEWELHGGEERLDSILWPVARSAADLLTSGDLERVRECGAHDCTWLFMDRSKNRSRRWCDMGDCGNRAKVKRFYERKKAQGA
jgi:predicted RNA-binding Zn ribbon-like protein